MAPPTHRGPDPIGPPLHRRSAAVAQVALGGVFGAAGRDVIEQAWPAGKGGFPLATLVINLSGALLLGVLLEALVRAGDDTGSRRRARLVVGTGFLGAYTTYSTFVVEADLLVRDGHGTTALAYAVLTVVAGLGATALGIAGAARAGRQDHRALGQQGGRTIPVDPDLDPEEER